jgi:DNA-binding CsgD family transcriptional regulator
VNAVTVRTPDSGFESLELRFERIQRFVPYLLLTFPLIPYVLSQNTSARAVGITVGVAVAASAWITWWISLHPAVRSRRCGRRHWRTAGSPRHWPTRQPAREPLSQRELDILELVAQGCSNREAAARLFISEATVKTHVLHIYTKLGVNDRAAAVAAGFERRLLPRS